MIFPKYLFHNQYLFKVVLILLKYIFRMTKINKKKIEEFIRVDHAGERGAIKIYEGQLLALNTFIKDDDLKKTTYDFSRFETNFEKINF